jgi:hypothetical protein
MSLEAAPFGTSSNCSYLHGALTWFGGSGTKRQPARACRRPSLRLRGLPPLLEALSPSQTGSLSEEVLPRRSDRSIQTHRTITSSPRRQQVGVPAWFSAPSARRSVRRGRRFYFALTTEADEEAEAFRGESRPRRHHVRSADVRDHRYRGGRDQHPDCVGHVLVGGAGGWTRSKAQERRATRAVDLLRGGPPLKAGGRQ